MLPMCIAIALVSLMQLGVALQEFAIRNSPEPSVFEWFHAQLSERIANHRKTDDVAGHSCGKQLTCMALAEV
jgi:hypothetical protein